MKKWIACLMATALLIGIVPVALAANETQSTVDFKVGYGAINVTPKLVKSSETEQGNPSDGVMVGEPIYHMEGATQPVHLAGSGDTETRLAQTVEEGNELWMKAIALSDGTTTKVVMTTDFIRVPVEWNVKAEKAFFELYPGYKTTYSLQDGFLSMSGTHTHSSVDIGDAYERNGKVINSQDAKCHTSNLDGNNKDKETTYYKKYWLPGAVEAVAKALDNMTSATIQTASVAVTDAEGNYNVNRVRHWLTSDGTMAGANFENSTPVGRVRAADPEMQLIRFVREDNDAEKAKDIVLVNWQMHPTGAMGSTGTAQRRTISADYCGIICNYLTDNVDDCVAAYFQGAAGNVSSLRTKDGEAAPSGISSGYKNYGTYLGQQAVNALNSMKTVPVGKVKGLRNENTVVERGYATTRTIQQDVVTVGNSIAFVTAGYEMFDSNGLFVKAQARNMGYEIIFIIENAQGHEYMPDWQATHYTLLGGAEAYEATDSCHNEVPGTAEDLADSLVFMLDALYKQ